MITTSALAQTPDDMPQLVSLAIRNFRGIENLFLPIEHQTRQMSGTWTCLSGPGGVGKTSVLQALCLCLLGPRRAEEIGTRMLQRMRRCVDGQARDAEIEVVLRRGDRHQTLRLTITDDGVMGTEQHPGYRSQLGPPVLASYGAARDLPMRFEREWYEHESPVTRRQMSLFFPTAQLSRAYLLVGTRRLGDRLSGLVGNVLSAVFGDDVRIAHDARETSFMVGGNQVIAPDLPSGVRSFVVWLVDLCAAWCDTWYEASDRLEDVRAVVLIDEIDLHMHPSLQRDLIPRLRRALPGVQWVVTTNSPLVLASFERAELALLDPESDGGIRELDREILGFTMDQVYEFMMGTSPTSAAIQLPNYGALDAGLLLEMSPHYNEEAAKKRIAERRVLFRKLARLANPKTDAEPDENTES